MATRFSLLLACLIQQRFLSTIPPFFAVARLPTPEEKNINRRAKNWHRLSAYANLQEKCLASGSARVYAIRVFPLQRISTYMQASSGICDGEACARSRKKVLEVALSELESLKPGRAVYKKKGEVLFLTDRSLVKEEIEAELQKSRMCASPAPTNAS